MRKCMKCGEPMTPETTSIVNDSHGAVFVTRGVPSFACEMCADRVFTSETVAHLDAILRVARLPGVESATVDYASMVAHLTETGVIHAREAEAVAVAG